MSDTPTMLQDRMASMVHAFSDEGRKHAVRLLAADVGKLERKLAAAKARIKQLESEWSGWPALQQEWFADKYAAMQPWDAVRARMEDNAERVKRLEEAGDALVDHNIGCGCGQDGPCRACRMASDAWAAAKEAKP